MGDQGAMIRPYPPRMFKKAVQQGRNERGGETYSCLYVGPLSEARTKLAAFFNILPLAELQFRPPPVIQPDAVSYVAHPFQSAQRGVGGIDGGIVSKSRGDERLCLTVGRGEAQTVGRLRRHLSIQKVIDERRRQIFIAR